METALDTTEPCVQDHPLEHGKDANPNSHKIEEDLLLQQLDNITQSLRQHLEGRRTTRGEEEGQLPQEKELLQGQGASGQSLLLRLLEVLKGLGHMHTERAQSWRQAFGATAQLYSQWLRAGHGSQCDPLTGTISSILEDVQCVEARLSHMTQKLSTASMLTKEEALCTAVAAQEGTVASVDTHPATHAGHTEGEENFLSAYQHLSQSEATQSAHDMKTDPHDAESVYDASPSEDGTTSTPVGGGRHALSDSSEAKATGQQPGNNNGRPMARESPSNTDTVSVSEHIRASLCGSSGRTEQSLVDDREEDGQMEGEGLKERKRTQTDAELKEDSQGVRHGWVTKGLSGKPETHTPDQPILCYVTAPEEVSEVMTCDLVNGLSSLMVSDLEELVSNVLRLQLPDETKCSFPVTVVIPFKSRYRGNYRDIIVKVVDQASRVSYINPASLEGNYEGQKGSYAQVRVYSLGVFAVVSCLRKETYTIPRRGLSLKLSIDSRICLDYLPGSFSSPVIAQAVVQPVDPSLLCDLKSNRDVYQALLSTSPLLYLSHPSSQPPRRPLVLTLPCPPNPDRQRPGEEGGDPSHPRPTSAVHIQDLQLQPRLRAVSASVKTSREVAKEHLVLLGWKEEQWNVLDNVSVRNLQNGLVSFELMEHFERLIVLRLQGHVRSSRLCSMVEEIEDSVRRVMVTIVLQRLRQDPHSVVVAALPSTELSWEMAKLQAQAYCGPPEPSREIAMSEGDQLLLSFSGNITADRGLACPRTITFHHQRKSHTYLKVMVVDPFGNYSSPHYKGLAVFHHIPRAQLSWTDGTAVLAPQHPLVEPVCKLSLTLPKKLRITSRLTSAKVMPHTHYDSLSDELLAWLCEELCEEEAALLVLALRVKRSAVQLARLRAPTDSLPRQAFHVLGMWRRSLPSHAPKAPLLARCLARAGRPDLAKELLLRDGGGGGEG